MKIHEYQSIELLRKRGIPVSAGEVARSGSQAAEIFERLAKPVCMAKVQVLMGGRGKAGGVVSVRSAQEASAFCDKFIGKPFLTYQSGGQAKIVRAVLISESCPITQEYYLGIAIDRARSKPVILFSREGGMDIEEIALTRPEAIVKIHFSPENPPSGRDIETSIQSEFRQAGIVSQISDIAEKLARFFLEKDVAICEINPLSLSPDGSVTALDAKIVFDDNALFRHEDVAAMKDPDEDDDREARAKSAGLNYVSMDGNIGCLVNGAGLAMATMDMIKLAGGKPSNFLDVGGGATADQVREGFKIILRDPRVEAILVNIFGGIMKCDVIAEGVLQASREISLSVPLIVRLEGTRVEEGRELLSKSGLQIISCRTIKEAANTAVSQAALYRAGRGPDGAGKSQGVRS